MIGEEAQKRAAFELANPSIMHARELLLNPRVLILDTETTGLDNKAEVIDIALINLDGHAVLNTLVQCQEEIPQEATDIHGIDKKALAHAPRFPQIHAYLQYLLATYDIVIYNAEYDCRLLLQTAKRYALSLPNTPNVHCLMLMYSEFVDEPGRFGGYKYLSLARACIDLEIKQQGAHRALADCLATLEVLKRLAAIEE